MEELAAQQKAERERLAASMADGESEDWDDLEESLDHGNGSGESDHDSPHAASSDDEDVNYHAPPPSTQAPRVDSDSGEDHGNAKKSPKKGRAKVLVDASPTRQSFRISQF